MKTEFYKNPTSKQWILKESEGKQIVLLFEKPSSEFVDLDFVLQGERSDLEVLGIIVLSSLPPLKFRSQLIHKAKATRGRIRLWSVIRGGACQEVEGKILILKGAKGAESFFSHRTLTFDRAKSKTIPSLEIEENEVKASHAATTGEVDKEQIFYLQTRGLSEREAKQIIAAGFLEEAIEKIRDEKIKDMVNREISFAK